MNSRAVCFPSSVIATPAPWCNSRSLTSPAKAGLRDDRCLAAAALPKLQLLVQQVSVIPAVNDGVLRDY